MQQQLWLKLKIEQEQAVLILYEKKDVFADLPTSFGKSLIYQWKLFCYKKCGQCCYTVMPVVVVFIPLQSAHCHGANQKLDFCCMMALPLLSHVYIRSFHRFSSKRETAHSLSYPRSGISLFLIGIIWNDWATEILDCLGFSRHMKTTLNARSWKTKHAKNTSHTTGARLVASLFLLTMFWRHPWIISAHMH